MEVVVVVVVVVITFISFFCDTDFFIIFFGIIDVINSANFCIYVTSAFDNKNRLCSKTCGLVKFLESVKNTSTKETYSGSNTDPTPKRNQGGKKKLLT